MQCCSFLIHIHAVWTPWWLAARHWVSRWSPRCSCAHRVACTALRAIKSLCTWTAWSSARAPTAPAPSCVASSLHSRLTWRSLVSFRLTAKLKSVCYTKPHRTAPMTTKKHVRLEVFAFFFCLSLVVILDLFLFSYPNSAKKNRGPVFWYLIGQ